MISLSRLLTLQWVYVVLGVGYNIVSYIVVISGGQQLSTTLPIRGVPAMLMYGLFMIAAYKGRFKLYRFLMFLSILIYGWGGIGIHIMKYSRDPSLYASFTAWFIAIGINVFGLVLSLIVVSGRYLLDDQSVK